MVIPMMRFLFFLFGILLSALLGSCNRSTGEGEGEKLTVFRYNESKGISSLDPALARNQTLIWPVTQIFNGLVQLDERLRVRPAIASGWEISENGKVYTFHLRRDVWFHPSSFFPDSTRRVTARDFVYSFNRVLDPATTSPGVWIFDHLDPERRFEAVNDSTLVIFLEDPFPPFLSILSMPYCSVVPREVTEALGRDFAMNPIGTGPFLFRHWSRDEKLVLRKNPDYFERDSAGRRLPYLDAVAITFIKDKQSEFLEFMKGNLDFLSGVHPAYKDELLTRSGALNPDYEERFRLITQPYLNTEYLGFLMKPGADPVAQPLQDLRIRKAINYGFDRRRMMKYLRNNLGYPATAGFIPGGLQGGIAKGEGYGYDPDRSRVLLEKAGYPGGEGLPSVTLTTTSDYLDLCEFIQYELSNLGINLEIEVSTGASFRNRVANGNLDFFRGSWIADYADAENYLALFQSGNKAPEGPNYTRFSSPEYDLLYEEAIACRDDSLRVALYRQMDSLVTHQAPVVPLYYDMVVRFVPVTVSGLGSNPMNLLVLKHVQKKPDSTSPGTVGPFPGAGSGVPPGRSTAGHSGRGSHPG